VIELYGMSSPNVIKVVIMLEETGLPYTLKLIDVFKQQQYDPEFTRISPTNKVPVLVDPSGPDGRPITVFESGAILLYLAEKTGRFMPADPRGRTAVWEWLMVQMSLIGPMGGQAAHFLLFAPAGNDYARERYLSQCANWHKLLDTCLAEQAWIAGEECSIADFATFPWVHHATEFMPWLKGDGEALGRLHPHLYRWYREAGSRPGVAKAMALRQQLRKNSTRGQVNADALDRFTLRGAYSMVPR
jgi:GST-like protein